MSLKLQIAQLGLPGLAETSKTLIFTILSGVAMFFVCVCVLIALFVTDSSINTTQQLANATKSKVIGSLNLIPEDDITIKTIWNNTETNNNYNIHIHSHYNYMLT